MSTARVGVYLTRDQIEALQLAARKYASTLVDVDPELLARVGSALERLDHEYAGARATIWRDRPTADDEPDQEHEPAVQLWRDE